MSTWPIRVGGIYHTQSQLPHQGFYFVTAIDEYEIYYLWQGKYYSSSSEKTFRLMAEPGGSILLASVVYMLKSAMSCADASAELVAALDVALTLAKSEVLK